MTTETKFTVGEYKTRGGSDAKVFIINKDGTMVGGRQLTDGSWTSEMWFGDGRARVAGKSPNDLMPPLRECWRIDNSGLVFDTREKAEKHASCLWVDGAPAGLTITKYREVRDDQA